MEASPLAGRIAVVTGSSGGIGSATAKALAAAGADVVVHTRRNRAGAEATSASLREFGRKTHVLVADLRGSDEQDRLVDEAWAWQGRVDLWVNNAGADVLTGEASKWSFERKLEELWLVDVVATMRLSRQIGERMTQCCGRRDRSIVNMGWDQSAQGMAGDSGEMFAATKGAVMAFSRSLAQSLAPHVRVNCVAPGWIRTAWGQTASAEWERRAVGDSLMERWGTAEDVAQAIVYLASASFLSGQVLPVNGGYRYGPRGESP